MVVMGSDLSTEFSCSSVMLVIGEELAVPLGACSKASSSSLSADKIGSTGVSGKPKNVKSIKHSYILHV